MSEEPRYLAVDLGGTNLKYALINRSGQMIKRSRMETPHEGLTQFLEAIEKISEAS